MSVAALRELRRLLADSHLLLIARPWVAGLFENQGLVDEIHTIDPAETRLAQLRSTVRKVRGYDRAILFQNAFEAALVAALARIPDRAGYSTDGRRLLLTRRAKPRIKKRNRHQIYYYLDLLHQTGISPRNYLQDNGFQPDIRLKAPAGGVQSARRLLGENNVVVDKPLVVLNPGAYFGSAKRWFIDRYAALADRLIARGSQVVFVGSAGERAIADRIAAGMRASATILSGATDLGTLMGLLSVSQLFITNDSGPMHLAAALDIPQIALFGSTDEIATGPYSRNARIIHKHVECSPCLLRECPLDLRCFRAIEVDEVYEAALSVLRHAQYPISGA